MDRLSPLDSGFLHLEDRHTSLHIASVGIFEGPPPPYEDVAAMVASKLPLVERLRQVVRTVPLDLGRPVWVDDTHFDLGYHLRHTALPRPGGDVQLRRLVGRLMSAKLDRDKPLWETWMVEGLDHDRWAMITKLHHCMVDGLAGTDMLSTILDRSPDARPGGMAPWAPRREPNGLALVADALGDRALNPWEQVSAAGSVLRAPRALVSVAGETALGLAAYLGAVRPTSATSLCGPIGPHRRFRWALVALDDVRTVRRAYGGTVNDVVLTAITRAYRDLLLGRNEPLTGHRVRSLVPVSLREPDERGRWDNRLSAMLVELPVEIVDPVARLYEMRERMRSTKESHEAFAGGVATSLAAYAPPPLLAAALHVAFRVPHRNLTTVTTNVPGPPVPLYAVGRRLLMTYPYVPIANRLRTGVAVTSYDDRLAFGVTGDRDTVPDLDVLSDGIEAGVAELVQSASALAAARP